MGRGGRGEGEGGGVLLVTRDFSQRLKTSQVRNHRWSLENITDHILYKNNSVDSSYQIAQKAL